MDIVRQTKKSTWLKRFWLPIAISGALVLVFGVSRLFGGASYSVDRDKLIFGEVKRGEFAVQIRGVGVLVPKHIQWLSANVEGHVESIEVEAGAHVKKGDVIVTMSNPKLKEMLKESQWELEAQSMENRAAEMALESELADLRAVARNAELDHQSANLKLVAEGKLVEQGIVSRITYEQSKLTVEQHRRRISSQRERVAKMEAKCAALVDAHSARLNKLRNSHNLIQQQIEDLEVRARIDGVVQEMPLKLGQQVTLGIQVARIAPHDDLIALLDVQDFQVRDITIGQVVTIDTRSAKIGGKVARIDPAVVNGVVKVEVALTGKLPPEARPDLSVEGVIEVERKSNALFVERPSFAASYGKAILYVVNDEAADAVNVELGRASTRHIEVIKGLKEGDRIIISDSSSWEGRNRIKIK